MSHDQKYKLSDEVAVIIGSGAGGGTLSGALAQRGIDIVCLEAGKRLAMTDIVNNEAEMFAKLTWLDERIGTGDTIPDFPTWTCKTVGGSTMHWTASCPRLQRHETRARSTYGEIPGATHTDWPLPYAELEDYYVKAEALLGVTGTNGIERLPANNNYLVLEAGARKVGYRDMDTNNMAINSKPRDGRPACLQTGFCSSGCVIGAKWSTLYTEIPRAEQTPNFELRSGCMATKILTGNSGRVSAVQYLDNDGTLREQRARFVCVAGNTVETTRLLLNSRNSRFPGGLANSSDQLGRNYMRHMMSAVVGVMPGEVAMYKGAQLAGIVRDEAGHDPERGFAGGFLINTVPFTPETLATLLMPNLWGHELTAVLDRYNDLAILLIIGEDLPTSENRITLHPDKKDHAGLPVPVVNYTNHENSLAMRHYALKAAHNIYASLGAEKIIDAVTFPATHNMGVARMGEDPSNSVCNPWGQTHDIDNLFISDGSVFPTSGCANPTLTIISLTLRQADYITKQLSTGSI